MLSTRCTLVVLISLIYVGYVSSFGIPSPFNLQRLQYATSSKSLFDVNSRFAQSKKLASPRMSDMSDMTIEMLKRMERTLDQLSETDLIRVKGMCTNVGNKCDTILSKLRVIEPAPKAATSSAAAAAPPSKLSTKPVIQDPRKAAESEADKFFGISEPLSESGEPIRKTQGRTEPDISFLKQQAKIQEQKAVQVSPSSASKYLEIKPDAAAKNFATDEAVVEEDEWTKAYIQEFGMPPPTEALVDEDVPRPPPKNGENDAFAFLRQVQASAHTYASPDDYYKALNEAIGKWKRSKREQGQVLGSATSDRYLEQLFDMKPFETATRVGKLSLQATLNEVKAVDETGEEVDVLVCTQVDRNGALGVAGVQVGDALMELDGARVPNFAALREVMGRIHAAGKAAVQIVIHQKETGRAVELKIFS